MKEFKSRGECVNNKIEDKRRISVYASNDTLIKLKSLAIDNGTTISEMLRVMIDDYIESHSATVNSRAV